MEVLREVDQHRRVAALAGEARAPAAQDDRRPVLAADAVDLDELVHVARDDDADRRHPVVRGVGRVEGAAAGVEADLALDRRRSSAARPATTCDAPPVACRSPHRGAQRVTSASCTLKRAASALLELEPVARPRAVGPQDAALRLGHAVEEHPLDPDVVVEVLEVPQPLDGAEGVRRDRGAQWRREVDRVRVRERRRPRAGQ